MHCAIYKSSKKASTYLYINRKDDFSGVPEQLLSTFGNPQFVMMVNLEKRETGVC
ncbi:YcgL domain-containing protein [Enterovibrio sp. Hal110]